MRAIRRTSLVIALASGVTLGCEPASTDEQAGATVEDTTAAEETAPVDMASARAAIQASADAWETAMVAGDVEGLVALNTDDAIVMGTGMPPARGTDEIRAAYQAMVSQVDFEEFSIDMERTEVAESGDIAWAVGTSTARVTLPDGETAETQDQFSVAFENVDGQWLVAADVWNTVEAPAAE